MIPKSEQRKIAIIDVVNQLEISGHDKSRGCIYIKFKNEYPRLKTRNRPEWNSLFESMKNDELVIAKDTGYFVTDKGHEYYAQVTRGTSTSITVEHSKNVQIGDQNVMSINYIIDSFKNLEDKIQSDNSMDPAQKESLLKKVKNTIDNIEYFRKIPELAVYISELFSKFNG